MEKACTVESNARAIDNCRKYGITSVVSLIVGFPGETAETLERTLNETRSAALDAERWLREEADVLRAHGLEREEYLNAQLASERVEYENRLAEMQTEHECLAQARAAADKNVQRLSADLTEGTRILEDARREFQNTIDRQSTDHATALAALID